MTSLEDRWKWPRHARSLSTINKWFHYSVTHPGFRRTSWGVSREIVEYINKHFELQRITPDISQNISESFVRQNNLRAQPNAYFFFLRIHKLEFPGYGTYFMDFPLKTGWEKQLLYNNVVYASRYAVSLRGFVTKISSFPQNAMRPPLGVSNCKKKFRRLSPQANYTDRAAAAGRRS